MNLKFFNDSNIIHVDISSISIYLAELTSKFKKVAYFPTKNYTHSSLKKNLLRLKPDMQIIEFPDFDCNFFSNLSPTTKNKTQRISALYKLIFLDNKNTIFLGSMKSLVTKTIPNINLEKSRIRITPKSKLKYDEINNFLNEAGYEKVDFVNNTGEYAIRGEIMDIFSPIHNFPVRILFDFDTIENLNYFSVENQLSFEKVNGYNLFLSSEFQFNNKNIECFRRLFRKLNIKDKDDYYKSITKKIILPGSDQFFPILNNEYSSLLDYLRNFKLIFDFNYKKDFIESFNQYIEGHIYYQKLLKFESSFLLKPELFIETIKERTLIVNNHELKNSGKKEIIFSENLDLKIDKKENLKKVLNLIKKNKIVIFCFFSKVNKKKLDNLLKSYGLLHKVIKVFDKSNFNNISTKIFTLELEIKSSFILNDFYTQNIYFISELDIFTKTIKKEISSPVKEDNLIEEYSSLKIGDYIVHNDHGIAKYNGLKIKDVNNFPQEFLELVYFGNDKLLIPVENLEVISKYSQGEVSVTLDKLGLQNWQYRKAIVKKRIKDIAKTLIKTAAERELKKSEILIPESLEYEKFSSEFEFTETSDQIKSIHQIESDLSSGKPMDRLICGDVGFGKTEIAMRASFIAVSSGYQVAIICPKLLLLNQHAKNFRNRFKNFSYRIEKISRLESTTKKKEIIENLKIGSIDILIGTHAILSNKIDFKKLGLIIIDEEQSFGVEQKEKLKKLKPNTHMLTLTATPIPRTLQSSIFQLKKISLIKTAPLSRLNIKTFLMLYDRVQIKKIICNEINRGGQVFYVAPRIADLDVINKRLTKLIPDLKFDMIHGQLSSKQIEDSYNRFFEQKSKLLLSTAMIESGLDISNVNTVIIEKPQLFGLSQLYQLRGRVGRSSRQAYAYLVLDNFKSISENSIRKLKIISKINSLGAGFSIASNDLDIRGGGNIVGSEQSGHIREVGLELYYKMLRDTISELKNSKHLDQEWSPSINLGFPVSIPENYIKDIDVRLNLYRKISNIQDVEELNRILLNFKDRFGKIPTSFKNLFHIIEIKIMAKKNNIKKIDNSKKGFVLEFKNDNIVNVDKLIKIVEKNYKFLKLMPDSKLFFKNNKTQDIERIKDLKNLLIVLSR